MTEKSKSLYQKTYQSMIDRTHEDGYADTSITGHYQGMFCRDTSIQIMCHIAHGDYDRAKLLMTYILDYHVNNNYDFAIHVIYENHEPSLRIQADTTFFFLHAWYLYAVKAPETAEKKAFLEKYYGKIKTFANFYLDRGNLDNEFDLLFNENLEHSRCGDYWFSYDLLTNVYASQALHEMADYFKAKDVDNAEKWEAAAAKIVAGVHKNLVTEIDGKVMYAELMGKTETTVKNAPETPDQFIQGFSWVNLAPMGCDWYGADPEILENTYRLYLKYGACDYYNKYYMLNVVSDFNGSPIQMGDHVIGKGLAWEMLYCNKMGYTDRLAELTAFVEEYSVDMYRETWGYTGGGSDTANQEHASWMLYTHKLIYPELGSEQSL